ncbi:MAG: dTMP kinase [Gammaproteobacteria bacterium]|nr:dTMP kinase [Gammaproteobacteria bacterium]
MTETKNLPAKFITVEGVEGVGKTTNIDAMRGVLEQRGIDFILTREPGGTPLAEEIRDMLLKDQDENVTSQTELLLIFAARAQHLNQVIKPSLDQGVWVICDRFTDATYAYQGGGRGIDSAKISLLENLVQEELRPDLTLILDLDPQVGLSRATNRGELDRFEKQQLDFFDRVRKVYLQRAAAEPHRCVIIDASHELEQVKASVAAAMEALCDSID